MNTVQLSQELLLKVKMGEDTKALVDEVSTLPKHQMTNDLVSQEDRLTFWLNLYNAFFQIKVKERPELFDNKVKLFFGRHFIIAGHKLSLDDIEHDFLRKSMYKWSLGYIRKPFPSEFKKAFQIFEMDPRIHFALNCGAKSCPPIRFYEADNVQEQLDLATRSFLSQEVYYHEASQTAKATSLFSFFRGDFGGKKGIRNFLLKYDLIPDTDVKLKFAKYNWEEEPEKYV